jgi:hypothetical protein
MSYVADDTQAIAQRMKELKADRDLYVKGTSAPTDGQEPKAEQPSWANYMTGYDDCA